MIGAGQAFFSMVAAGTVLVLAKPSSTRTFKVSSLVCPSCVSPIANQLPQEDEDSFILDAWDYAGGYIAYEPVGSHLDFLDSTVKCEKCLSPVEVVLRQKANCFVPETPILTFGSKGEYKPTCLGDLRVGDIVLSYNWQNSAFEPKPITTVWHQGLQSVVTVTMKNGGQFTCTPDHNFFRANVRWPRKGGRAYFQEPLTRVIEQQTDYKRLLVAHKIPALAKLRRTLPQLWVEGAYLAEGNASAYGPNYHRVTVAGDDPAFKFQLACSLIQTKTPFSMSRNSHSSYFTVRPSALKQALLQMGHKAVEKHLCPEHFLASEKQLEVLLDAYTKGDGSKRAKWGVAEYETTLSTISPTLAQDLGLLHLILGRPLHQRLQVNHGGFGKHPIWRLRHYRSRNSLSEPLPGLYDVYIEQATKAGEAEVIDIEVADNHNFVLADSHVLAHNCVGHSVLLASILRNRLPAERVLVAVGDLVLGDVGGHAWVLVERQGVWYVLESTTPPGPFPWWPASQLEGEYQPFVMFNDQGVRCDTPTLCIDIGECQSCLCRAHDYQPAL